MAMSCKQVVRLSTASAGGHATEAERLELEAHLATCVRCSEEHALALATTRALRAAEPGALSAAARERVRRAALSSQRAHAPALLTVRRFGWPLAGGAVLAMAAAVAIWIGTRAPADFSIVQGDVAVTAGPAAAPQDPAGRGVTVRSARGGEVRLADASTALAPATEIVWRHERRVVDLREGALTVDIPHRPGQHFEVRTPRFIVEVVGTRFTVDMKGVMTERGTVRLLSPDGKLIGYLEGGHAWAMPDTAAATGPAPAPTPPPEEGPAPPHDPAAPAAHSSAAPAASATSTEDSAAIRLGRARRALARGNAGEARRAVEPLFRLGRDVASEARALYAESFLIERRYADAIDGYQVVVRDFPSTPQAESALFAVAQLESEHGRPADARATLQRYLARYPHGRFAKEAADRLATMSPQPR
jgi:ferric-dicitrate binding protein FerR (iron transport regulator)